LTSVVVQLYNKICTQSLALDIIRDEYFFRHRIAIAPIAIAVLICLCYWIGIFLGFFNHQWNPSARNALSNYGGNFILV